MSSRPDCIFESHQLWQSGFSRVYSNCCCSCSFEPEIIKIGQSSHKMYSNNIGKFQCLYKKVWGLIECTTYIYIYIVIYRQSVSLYHNSSVWLDPRNASSWDRNPVDFTSVRYLKQKALVLLNVNEAVFTYIFLYIHHPLPGGLNSWDPYLRKNKNFTFYNFLYTYMCASVYLSTHNYISSSLYKNLFIIELSIYFILSISI